MAAPGSKLCCFLLVVCPLGSLAVRLGSEETSGPARAVSAATTEKSKKSEQFPMFLPGGGFPGGMAGLGAAAAGGFGGQMGGMMGGMRPGLTSTVAAAEQTAIMGEAARMQAEGAADAASVQAQVAFEAAKATQRQAELAAQGAIPTFQNAMQGAVPFIPFHANFGLTGTP
eukprot:TRINITY_DN26103_c0_g1_i1.p3 TRINITY_DN26103_c0_g1~~TRINITY_DN26103_c0_g1_i1.p3  ORF type:complete len:171 (-),score=49.19 TRINITY_DN26103_c0_g1_i1:163-675(-)